MIHPVTDACADVHCHAHHVDEPRPAWRVCFECGHAYPSARALRRVYCRQYWRAAAWSRRHSYGDPLWRRVWRVSTVRTSLIRFCPHCLHDW